MRKQLLTVTILFMAGFLFTGCAGKSPHTESFDEYVYGKQEGRTLTAEEHEQLGDKNMRQGKQEMAFMHYNQCLSLDPQNLDVRIKKGELLVRKGLDEQALKEYVYILENEEDHAKAHAGAGSIYFRSGLYDEARAHLEKAIRINPMLWKAHNYLGILNDRDGDYDTAADNFATALDLHKGQGKAKIYNNLGVVHIARKQYGLAIDAFRRALKNGDVSSRTYNNLGLALARTNRLDEALESFKYAGGESKANNNLGYVLLTDDKPGKAVPYFERAIELAPAYYTKAADNLKRARLAAQFKKVALAKQNSGSTPNHLLRKSFPDAEQTPGGPAASPASAGPPPSSPIEKVAYTPGNGVDIQTPSYGLHVSSWRDHEWAFNHCAQLKKQGFETWVNQVDLGKKGIWYRVLVGKYDSIKSAQAERPEILTRLELDRASIYKRIQPVPDGSHL